LLHKVLAVTAAAAAAAITPPTPTAAAAAAAATVAAAAALSSRLYLARLQNNPALVEEVLSELAVFRQSRLGAAGYFCLKWVEQQRQHTSGLQPTTAIYHATNAASCEASWMCCTCHVLCWLVMRFSSL
jgi:hypothetical protein